MKAFFLFFKIWLAACFVLTFFVVPLYLIAIFPEVPEPYYRFARSIGYGVVRGDSSVMAFWYRLTSCGLVVSMGVLMVWNWLRDIGRADKREKDVSGITDHSIGNSFRKYAKFGAVLLIATGLASTIYFSPNREERRKAELAACKKHCAPMAGLMEGTRQFPNAPATERRNYERFPKCICR